MSAFKALNIESDDESDVEIDDTKEVQIEEALKLYQTALKYHAEGPTAHDKAVEAYNALLQSELFQTVELSSGHAEVIDNQTFDRLLQDDLEVRAGPLVATGDNTPNTLPQILHLSYKNYGQFLLDSQQYLPKATSSSEVSVVPSLKLFVKALDNDGTDLDLWTRTSSLSGMAGSSRITRYCLEAILDSEGDDIESILRLPGLEEGFSGQQLRLLTNALQDDLSLKQGPLASFKRKNLSAALLKKLNPYSFAPEPSKVSLTSEVEHLSLIGKSSPNTTLIPARRDWMSIGQAILQQLLASERDGQSGPSPIITIELPVDTTLEPTPTSNKSRPVLGVLPPVESSKLLLAVTAEGSANTPTDDVEMRDTVVVQPTKEPDSAVTAGASPSATEKPESTQPVSRKRSTDSAGLPETADGGRIRSKRIRARESIPDGVQREDNSALDLSKQIESQLAQYEQADNFVFEIVHDILSKVHVKSLSSPKAVKELILKALARTPVTAEQLTSSQDSLETVMLDLISMLQTCTQSTANLLMNGENLDQLGSFSREKGLNAFHGYTKPTNSQKCTKQALIGDRELSAWVNHINSDDISIKEVALSWTECLLKPGVFRMGRKSGKDSPSSYMQHLWQDDLKALVVQMIINLDESLFLRVSEQVSLLSVDLLKAKTINKRCKLSQVQASIPELVQNLFELHLDVYSRFKHPGSGIPPLTQTLQKDRLDRWCALARDALQLRMSVDSNKSSLDELAVRHIWASAFHISVCNDVTQEYIFACMEDLKIILTSLDEPVIQIQNNAVMPEISIAAADSELSKMNMKDFFMKVFDTDEKDPVVIIETIEPILEPVAEIKAEEAKEQAPPKPKVIETPRERPNTRRRKEKTTELPERRKVTKTPAKKEPSVDRSPLHEMRRFLANSNILITLSLWQRLRESYENIEYTPKVVSCYLRSLECVMKSFQSPTYTDAPQDARTLTLLHRMRIIDEILSKTVSTVRHDQTAFDCLDEDHLQSSMTALTEVLKLGQTLHVYEDMLRVGQLQPPVPEGRSTNPHQAVIDKLHDTQMRAWILLYYLLGEAMAQNVALFPTPYDDKFEFIRHVHYATGTRGYCQGSNRTFLRLCKEELLRLSDVTDGNTRDNELAQALYDLYGLKCFTNPTDCMEFETSSEPLDRKTATSLLDFIMSQARKINMKDLPKTELKATIDKVHGCLGRPKQNEDMVMNRKIISQYLKSPVYPVDMFRCLGGIGTLSTKPINPSQAPIACKGWFYLMGSIALNRFKSQKRLVPGPTEDLNIAVAFFMQDLEYAVDHWETWYRLAQAYDAQIEEAVSWSAEKLNSNNSEIHQLQRAAIHSYTMAVACAVRSADFSPQTTSKITDMYGEFGMRIYSSSRQPFSMQSFISKESEYRYYSRETIYHQPAFQPLSSYTACKLASKLFKRAIAGKPDYWMYHYMLGKCLWKMHTPGEDYRGPDTPPDVRAVIDALERAIDALPDKAGSHSARKEPTLEPHYKLVSIVHKLVQRKEIEPKEGSAILQSTSYSKSIPQSAEMDTWETYVLAILKALRSADKSGWHHRMTARAAHVIYDETSDDFMAAMAAKSELTHQMFTKTMAVQVWKPENERPGRHFVYTSRYTRFFIRLLSQTSDRPNFEALSKRIRKKPHEFFEHSKLWQELCITYLKLLRRTAKVPDGHEDAVFKSLSHEEFSRVSGRLEVWCHSPDTQSLLLDTLRDAIELRRLNNNLMKPLLIDDLVCDTYALLYAQVGLTLETPTAEEVTAMNAPASAPAPNVGISLNNLMQADGSGATPGATATATAANPPSGPLVQVIPPQPQPQPPADQTSRPRTKGVGRRELVRRAEAAATRPATAAVTTQSSENQSGQAMVESRSKTEPSIETEASTAVAPNPQLKIVAQAENSAPATAQHSEEEESELSELDEDDEGDTNMADVQQLFHDAPAQPSGEGISTADVSPAVSTYATPEPGIDENGGGETEEKAADA